MMRDLVEAWNVQDGATKVFVFDGLKMGVGSTPIRLAQQQIWREICDTISLKLRPQKIISPS